jgi:hypothetical protein
MNSMPICCAALLLGSCATAPPPLTSASPASPEAPEGARTPRQTALRADELTRKTATLLSAAQKEQEGWDEHGPVSGDNTKPETNHEQH